MLTAALNPPFFVIRDPQPAVAVLGRPSMTSIPDGRRNPPTASELADLIEAVARSADRAAFTELFRHFAPRLKAFLMRAGVSPGTAEELAQETLVKLWRRAGSYDRQRAAASTWVFTIARNLRIDTQRRGGGNLAEIDDEAVAVADDAVPVDEAVAALRDGERVRTALLALPDEQRRVLELSYFEELAHASIANTLGIPLGTVKSRIRLAVDQLRRSLLTRRS